MLLNRPRWLLVLLGPAAVWVLAFVVAPAIAILVMSFWRVESYQLIPDLSGENYARIISRSVYYGTLFKSLGIAVIVTCTTLALAVPLAYVIAFKVQRNRAFWYGMIVMSLWVGYLLRAYAWRLILGSNGVLNGILIDTGLVEEPLSFLLFSPFSVIVTLTHLSLPFALIPIFSAMEQVPVAMHEAASDLGANPVRRFVRITFPLTAHGILAGGSFAFILSFGDFLAPVLVGGPEGVMISNIAASQFGASLQWPLGAALSTVMFVIVLLVLAAPDLLARRRGASGGGTAAPPSIPVAAVRTSEAGGHG